MLGTTTFSIGLQLAKHLKFKKIRSDVPLASGALEPDMRF